MGEYADDAIDREINGWIDDDGDFDGDDPYSCVTPPRLVTCKYCKKKGFHWKKTEKGWRLFNKDRMHSCLGEKK